MRRPVAYAVLLFMPLLVAPTAADEEPRRPDGETPRKIGLVEEARTRLAQLDVTVTGPADVIGELTAEDFELVLVGKTIDDFTVDRVCPAAAPSRPSASAASPALPAEERESAPLRPSYDGSHTPFPGPSGSYGRVPPARAPPTERFPFGEEAEPWDT